MLRARLIGFVSAAAFVGGCKAKPKDEGADPQPPSTPGSASPANADAPAAAATAADAAPLTSDALEGAEELVTRNEFGCARLSNGKVACWGSDREGTLGDGAGTQTDCPNQSCKRPVLVSGLDDAVALTAEITYACALRAAGGVVCWGKGGYGQLGAKVVPDVCTSTMGVAHGCALAPVEVDGLSRVVSIAAGGNHVCAADADGAVWCWGSGPGAGPALPDTCTVGKRSEKCIKQATKIPGVKDAVEVASAELATCYRTRAGKVRCWGEHNSGELGDGKSTRHASARPVDVTGIDDAVQLAGFTFGFCARRASGLVHCWGNNDSGNLGDGTLGGAQGKNAVLGRGKPGPVLVDVAAKTPLTGATDLWVAGETGCARTGDAVYCWGPIPRDQLPESVVADPCPAASDRSCKGLGAVRVGDPATLRRYHHGGVVACALLTSGRVSCRYTGTVPAPK